MSKKMAALFCAMILMLSLFGCQSTSGTFDEYTVKEESERFRGKLVSTVVEQYEFTPSLYTLKVSNGQKVVAGALLAELNDTGKNVLKEQAYIAGAGVSLSKTITAKNDGLVVLDTSNIKVYSDCVNFVFNTPSHNFEKFYPSKEKYTLLYNSSSIGSLTFLYYVPGQGESTYDLVYSVENAGGHILLHNSYADMAAEKKIYIPTAYITSDEDGKFYVFQKSERKQIEAVLENGQYRLISGLKVGDKIERIN